MKNAREMGSNNRLTTLLTILNRGQLGLCTNSNDKEPKEILSKIKGLLDSSFFGYTEVSTFPVNFFFKTMMIFMESDDKQILGLSVDCFSRGLQNSLIQLDLFGNFGVVETWSSILLETNPINESNMDLFNSLVSFFLEYYWSFEMYENQVLLFTQFEYLIKKINGKYPLVKTPNCLTPLLDLLLQIVLLLETNIALKCFDNPNLKKSISFLFSNVLDFEEEIQNQILLLFSLFVQNSSDLLFLQNQIQLLPLLEHLISQEGTFRSSIFALSTLVALDNSALFLLGMHRMDLINISFSFFEKDSRFLRDEAMQPILQLCHVIIWSWNAQLIIPHVFPDSSTLC